MDTKNNTIHVNPKHKWCMKKFGQKLRNWKFFSFDRLSINRIPIKPSQEQWLKIKGFSINRKTHSIDWNSGRLDSLKSCRSLCRKHSTQIISWMKCMSMSLNVFQNHMNSTQIFQRQDFQPFVPKTQTLNIFCIKIKEHTILDGQINFTKNFIY